MSTNDILKLSDRCKNLAMRYEENISETEEILSAIDTIWNGTELDQNIQKIQSGFLETKKTIQMLECLSKLLLETGEDMRNAEQMAVSKIKNSIIF